MYAEVVVEPMFNNRPATMLLGDANGDGKVDISDVTTTIDRILKDTWTANDGTFILRNADVNADDRIDISDVTGIIDIVLGREEWSFFDSEDIERPKTINGHDHSVSFRSPKNIRKSISSDTIF